MRTRHLALLLVAALGAWWWLRRREQGRLDARRRCWLRRRERERARALLVGAGPSLVGGAAAGLVPDDGGGGGGGGGGGAVGPADACSAERARVRALELPPGWRPLAEAPRDKPVLLSTLAALRGGGGGAEPVLGYNYRGFGRTLAFWPAEALAPAQSTWVFRADGRLLAAGDPGYGLTFTGDRSARDPGPAHRLSPDADADALLAATCASLLVAPRGALGDPRRDGRARFFGGERVVDTTAYYPALESSDELRAQFTWFARPLYVAGALPL